MAKSFPTSLESQMIALFIATTAAFGLLCLHAAPATAASFAAPHAATATSRIPVLRARPYAVPAARVSSSPSEAHNAIDLPRTPFSPPLSPRSVSASTLLTPLFFLSIPGTLALLARWMGRRSFKTSPRLLSLAAAPAAHPSWLPTIPSPEPTDPLSDMRTAAKEALLDCPAPDSKREEWRFTDLAPLQRCTVIMSPPGASMPHLQPHGCEAADPSRVVLLDGRPTGPLPALPDGVYLGPLSQAPPALLPPFHSPPPDPFLFHLNRTLAPDPLCLLVPAGIRLPTPLHLVYAHGPGTPAACPLGVSRVVVALGAGAAAEVFEEFPGVAKGAEGEERGLVVPCLEIQLGAGAALQHTVLQDHPSSALHLKTTVVNQAAESRYSEVEINLGGTLARHDVTVRQEGPGTMTRLQAFSLVGQGQCHDLHSRVQLAHPNGVVEQLHKQIAAHASAKGVFDGNVRVGQEAQQTDAAQLTRSLLLQRGATVNVKPNLQIIADDVKCSHGCTIADLEPEEVFYLRARGLTEAQAREALVFSFGCEVLDQVGWPDVRSRVADRIREQLGLTEVAL